MGIFGIVHGALTSIPFQIAGNLSVVLAIAFWLGLAYWMVRDARRRIKDPWLVGSAALLGVVVPYLGAVIYLLVRPPETIAEAHARELEVRALTERLHERDERCPVCRAETEATFLVCPVCTTQLRQPCRTCEAALEPLWQACPYCATPTAPPVLEPVVEDLDEALARESSRRKPSTRQPAS